MTISRATTRPVNPGPADYFSGQVSVEMLNQPDAPARVAVASVTFQPGARTAWHTHPLGQTLVITEGQGRVQVEGGPVQIVNAGDVVWFPPHEKHWHGASETSSMTHLSIQEALDGTAVTWMEQVTD